MSLQKHLKDGTAAVKWVNTPRGCFVGVQKIKLSSWQMESQGFN